MPTYQYECSACGYELEVLQSIADSKLIKCPKCRKNRLARLIGTGSGIIFKGSGFYATDYKKKEPAPQKSSEKPAELPGCKAESCACSQDQAGSA